ncbi:MAG: NAD(P)-binding domain-containing protein [Deltaproteobacteria bacterium]|nr:NAD(P)-binding domain-containing protein [Deltaproteobacteria bacterium]
MDVLLEHIELTLFVVLSALVIAPYWIRTSRRERRHRAQFEEAVSAGLEPASLHPVIDPLKCIGTADCTPACPEGDVLGVVDGRAVLANPTHCIGHGACLAACPVEAISLVFGTATRGVEIPNVKPNFETNVAGLYIAGELGGMGLIRNAMTQGRQAVDGIARELRGGGAGARGGDVLDLFIVGAGPSGLAAALTARKAGLRFEIVDQEQVGGSVYHYPRKKVVVTSEFEIPFYGTVKARAISKEELLAIWHEVIDAARLEIHTGERVDTVSRDGGLFAITTSRRTYRARRVLLAIGRRGSPRKLEVPGEEAPHVAYSLADAADFHGDRVLVVGGGNSALEAASALAEPTLENHVTLSYRGDVFSRATASVRRQFEELADTGRVRAVLRSEVRAIHERAVDLAADGRELRVGADRVFVFAGGVLPSAFLRQLGVAVDTKFGTA